jgi:hypothetical protein
MSDAGPALRRFLIEYKKRLPDTPENKEFADMIDRMISDLKESYIFYIGKWEEHISPNDERWFRDPTENERELIESRKLKELAERKKGLFGFLVKE